MPVLNLNIVVIPTYDLKTLFVADASTYPTNPPNVVSPTIEIKPPGFNSVVLPFLVNDYNIFTSVNLGINTSGNQDLPDGIYYLKYSINPAFENFVERSIMRVDKLQEKFDEAFLSLQMMQCDMAIKRQSMVQLDSIYYLIQGSIAAGNNCLDIEAMKLYNQADKMLNNFIKNKCNC